MVTIHNNSYFYDALSTDIKPVDNVPNGSTLYEMDTGEKYVFDITSKNWIRMNT